MLAEWRGAQGNHYTRFKGITYIRKYNIMDLDNSANMLDWNVGGNANRGGFQSRCDISSPV